MELQISLLKFRGNSYLEVSYIILNLILENLDNVTYRVTELKRPLLICYVSKNVHDIMGVYMKEKGDSAILHNKGAYCLYREDNNRGQMEILKEYAEQ